MDLEDRVKDMIRDWVKGLREEGADPNLSYYEWVTLTAAIVRFVGECEERRRADYEACVEKQLRQHNRDLDERKGYKDAAPPTAPG